MKKLIRNFTTGAIVMGVVSFAIISTKFMAIWLVLNACVLLITFIPETKKVNE